DRAGARRRRGHRPVLARMDADPDRGRHLLLWPVCRRLCAGAEARRRERWPASGLADVRLVRLRLPVWLRRLADRGPARRGVRRARALCAAAISRQSALYRRGVALERVLINRPPCPLSDKPDIQPTSPNVRV